MAKIKDRVLEYLKVSGITKQEFCEKTNISYSNMVGKSLQSELGGDQIYEILQKFPELNSDWLLLGRGEMLRQPATHIATSPGDNPSVAAFLNSKLEKTEAELALANQTIGELRYIIRQLKEKVSSPSAATTPESTFA